MRLTVMSYNIRAATFNPLGLEGIARVIEHYQPDIIGLQEVNVYGYPTGPVDQPRWLAERLGLYSAFGPARQYAEQVIRDQPGFAGNALLSRFPIQETTVEALPTPAENLQRWVVLGAALQIPTGRLNVFTTHWAADLALHTQQAQATLRIIQSWQSGAPVILLGDLNNLPESSAIATLRTALSDAWEQAYCPSAQRITYPSGSAGSTTPDGWSGTIDYIFASSVATIEKISAILDESRASDHNPVLAHVRLGR